MTRVFRAHFDGRVLVPDEPVEIPVKQPLHVQVTTATVSDPNVSLAERRAAIRQLLSRPIRGLTVPDASLRREAIYGDD